MHWLDIIILVITLSFCTLGYFSGLIGQLSTPLAVAGGAACVWYGQMPLEEKMRDWFQQPLAASAVALAVAFLSGFLLVKIAAAVLRSKIGNSESKTADHALGASFGTLKGLAISGVVVLLIGDYGKAEMMKDSFAAPSLYTCAQWVSQEVRQSELWQRMGAWTEQKGDATEAQLQQMVDDLHGSLKQTGASETARSLVKGSGGKGAPAKP